MRRALVVALVLASVLALGACSDASGADLEESRVRVRSAAEEQLPGLVEQLGGGVVFADGQYETFGLKDDISYAYEVEAQLVVDRGDSAAVVGALEGLGYEIVQDSGGTVVGESGDVRVSVATGGEDLRLTFHGPQLQVPDEERPTSRGHEEVALPSSLMVPAPPLPTQSPDS